MNIMISTKSLLENTIHCTDWCFQYKVTYKYTLSNVLFPREVLVMLLLAFPNDSDTALKLTKAQGPP